jgi:hypothetical protein
MLTIMASIKSIIEGQYIRIIVSPHSIGFSCLNAFIFVTCSELEKYSLLAQNELELNMTDVVRRRSQGHLAL